MKNLGRHVRTGAVAIAAGIFVNFGTMGDQGGLFYGLHMVEVDSRNYIYTGEVFAGERIQRFVPSDSARGKLLEQLSALP